MPFFGARIHRIQKIHEPEAHSREDRNIPLKDLSWRENLAGMSRSLGSCPHPATDSSDRESSILIDEEMVWKRDGGRGSSSACLFLFSFTKLYTLIIRWHPFYFAPKYNHNHLPKALRKFSLVISLVK